MTAIHKKERYEKEEKEIENAIETYRVLSKKQIIHSSPTLFNSMLKDRNQLASCLLVKMEDDSLTGIMNTLTHCA